MVFLRIAGKMPVENDKLPIVARWFDVWSWKRCKTLVRILLVSKDLIVLKDDFCVKILSNRVKKVIKGINNWH